MLPIVVARSSSGGVAIRYVFPVLWITSCFHVIAIRQAIIYPKATIEYDKHNSRDSNHILPNNKNQQAFILSCALDIAIYDCPVFSTKIHNKSNQWSLSIIAYPYVQAIINGPTRRLVMCRQSCRVSRTTSRHHGADIVGSCWPGVGPCVSALTAALKRSWCGYY